MFAAPPTPDIPGRKRLEHPWRGCHIVMKFSRPRRDEHEITRGPPVTPAITTHGRPEVPYLPLRHSSRMQRGADEPCQHTDDDPLKWAISRSGEV